MEVFLIWCLVIAVIFMANKNSELKLIIAELKRKMRKSKK